MTKYWTTINGEDIEYKKLKDSHLLNILKFIERKAKDGGVIIYGGGGDGWDAEDMWGDKEIIKGDEVLERYDYEGLLEEAKKRKLN